MTISMRILLSIFCAVSFLPISAFAHTGLGNASGFIAGFNHPFGGLDHLLAMVAVGLWAAQMGGRAAWFVPSAFVSMMIVGCLLGITGVTIPYIEEGILISVMILGVMIAGAFKLPLFISGVLVGIFAVFHGHAHGAEMPIAIGAVSYGVGMALATIILHTIGILAGMAVHKFKVENLARYVGCAITLGGIYLAVA